MTNPTTPIRIPKTDSGLSAICRICSGMARRGLQVEEFAAAAEAARGEAQPIALTSTIALQMKRDLELSEVVEIARTFVKVALV